MSLPMTQSFLDDVKDKEQVSSPKEALGERGNEADLDKQANNSLNSS